MRDIQLSGRELSSVNDQVRFWREMYMDIKEANVKLRESYCKLLLKKGEVESLLGELRQERIERSISRIKRNNVFKIG